MMKFNKKSLVLLICAALLLTFTVSGTVAYLVAGTDALVNTFTPPEIESKVDEDFDGTTKENVALLIKGNMEVKVRAAIVITWQDQNGNVAPEAPTSADYTLSINETDWTKGSDGFYYLNEPIQATTEGVKTPVLINSCTVTSAKDGYHLVVDVLGSTIQSNITWPN